MTLHVRRLDARDRVAADAWERFVRGEELRGGVRADILLSWHRSRDDYRVDPARQHAPLAAEADASSADSSVVAAELGAAAAGLAADAEAIGGIVSVADDQGRVLSAWGERAALMRAKEQNLRPWFEWSEAETGTTGIGLALETSGPAWVTRSEHWCSTFQDWSCNAVAVRDPLSREPIGVIAVSRWHADLPEGSIAQLVRAVYRVERRLHERLKQRTPAPPVRSGAATSPTRIAGTYAGKLIVLLAHEIAKAEFTDGVVWLQTDRGRVRAAARNLMELEERLGGGQFLRISRQVIVNADRVREVTRSRRSGVWILLDGTEVLLPVSRRRVPELRRVLNVR